MTWDLTMEAVAGFALIGLGMLMLVLILRRAKRDISIAPKPPPTLTKEAADKDVLEQLEQLGWFGQRNEIQQEQTQSSGLVRAVVAVVGFWPLGLFGVIFWLAWSAPPSSRAEIERRAAVDRQTRQIQEKKRYLCLAAAACKKYDQVRLECATAGNFRTCLRIKMGDDAAYRDTCSLSEGGPALLPPPETPTVLECFFLTLF
jgi:hypothetical protein